MKRERDEALGIIRPSRAGGLRKQASAARTNRAQDYPDETDPFNSAYSPSKLMGANVMLSSNAHQLAVGKPKRQIVQIGRAHV